MINFIRSFFSSSAPVGKRIAKNTALQLLSQGINLILSFGFVIFLMRFLGPTLYGRYVFVFSFTSIFFLGQSFLDELATRDIAKDKSLANNYLLTVIVTKLVVSFILFLVIVFVQNIMGYPPETKYLVYVISLYSILYVEGLCIQSVFRAFERFEYITVTDLFEKFFIVSVGAYILFFNGGLKPLVWIFVIAAVLKLSLLCFFIRKHIQIDLHFTIFPELCKYFFKSGYPILIGSYLVVFLTQIGILLLSNIKGEQDVGLYAAANRLYQITLFLSFAFTNSYFPIFSKYYATNKELAIKLYENSFKIMFILGTLIMVLVIALSEWLVSFLYGKDFFNSSIAVRIIFLALPFYFARNLMGIVLFTAGKQNLINMSLIIAVILSIGFNMVLIPLIGYIGVSITFVIQEVALFLCLRYLTSKYFLKIRIGIIAKSLMAGLVTIVFFLLFRNSNLLLITSFGVILFGGLLILIKMISKKEISLLIKALK